MVLSLWNLVFPIVRYTQIEDVEQGTEESIGAMEGGNDNRLEYTA